MTTTCPRRRRKPTHVPEQNHRPRAPGHHQDPRRVLAHRRDRLARVLRHRRSLTHVLGPQADRPVPAIGRSQGPIRTHIRHRDPRHAINHRPDRPPPPLDRRGVLSRLFRNHTRPPHVPDPLRRLRPPTDRQGGFATAELAAALPAFVLLLLTGLFAVNTVAIQTRCADAAREALLAESRGEDGRAAVHRQLPSQARINLDTTDDIVTAEITAQVHPLGSLLPAMTVTGRATAAREDRGTP